MYEFSKQLYVALDGSAVLKIGSFGSSSSAPPKPTSFYHRSIDGNKLSINGDFEEARNRRVRVESDPLGKAVGWGLGGDDPVECLESWQWDCEQAEPSELLFQFRNRSDVGN